MTKADIHCYRVNYNPSYWKDSEHSAMLLGALQAVSALCDEVVRLKRWKNV